jgi:hypothetical protein
VPKATPRLSAKRVSGLLKDRSDTGVNVVGMVD